MQKDDDNDIRYHDLLKIARKRRRIRKLLLNTPVRDDDDEPHSEVQYILMSNKLERMKSDIKEIRDTLKKGYLTRDQFMPVKLTVYGMSAAIVISVVSALVWYALKTH